MDAVSKAVVQSAFGPAPDVLSLQEVQAPTAESLGPTDVLVRVVASGIAKGDWLITHGLPYIARPAYGIRTPKQKIAGLQFAGDIVAVGRDVRDFSVGNAVFGAHSGAFAQLVVAPAAVLVSKPERVTYHQASIVPISGMAARQAVVQGIGSRKEPRVLVIGASGGVGALAVQIAKAMGSEVTGVASTANLPLVEALGADHVVDYTRQDPTENAGAYDVVIDIAGNRPVSRLRRALSSSGSLVIVGGTGRRWTMGFGRTVGALLIGPFVSQTIVALISTPNHADLLALAALMSDGKLTPVVRDVYPAARFAEAVEAAGTNHGSGLVLDWEQA